MHALLQHFSYQHLPPALANISKPFSEIAHAMANGENDPDAGGISTGRGSLSNASGQLTFMLEHLLVAKDAAVRAARETTDG